MWIFVVIAAAASIGLAYRLRTQAIDRVRLAADGQEGERRRQEMESLRRVAEAEAQALLRTAEVDALGAAQQAREDGERANAAILADTERRTLEAEQKEREVEHRRAEIEARAAATEAREAALRERETAVRAVRDEARVLDGEQRKKIEQLAGETGNDVRSRLIAEWLEEARAGAAERLRRVDAGTADPEHVRTAKRLMGIATQRYHGHYLTERMLTNLPIVIGSLPRIAGEGESNLRVIEEISHVKLLPAETGESIRLDGQDSFGREIARRAINRFAKQPPRVEAESRKTVQAIADALAREVMDLGRRAFKELEIPRAHPDIVKLVGKLNYRTSYTQNQWKHAVEASFLCGMIASELALDVKLARRAALMHDIGKALTHEIDGSHAVIGADLARKLGESEVVANAIGAHHTDEPFNSAYAYLVAAADAMSGARPGARRQQDDNYVERLDDLRRIASGFAGVDAAYPVQGGREVRVHVLEGRVSDVRAVELSSEIARRISDEMTFPGQIKVTVIRETRAIATAG